MSGDTSIQRDEVEALVAIYGENCIQCVTCRDNSLVFTLNFTLNTEENTIDISPTPSDAALEIVLPSTYPVQTPPIYTLSCARLNRRQRRVIDEHMQEVYLDNIGQPVLYEWIECVREQLLDLLTAEATTSPDRSTTPESPVKEATVDNIAERIITGDTFEDRKSTFQAHTCTVESRDEAMRVMRSLLTNNKVARATHNMYAYRIVLDDSTQQTDCDDDGEIGAGAKLSHLLDMMNATNVIVVITRWYGGVHLGPDRWRIINELARRQLVEGGYDTRNVQVEVDDRNVKKKHKNTKVRR